MHTQHATHTACTLVNRTQANAGALRQLRATTIVANKQTQALPLVMQAHAYLAGLSMPGHIGQRLLHQPVQMRLDRQRQARQAPTGHDPALHTLSDLPIVAEQLQRLFQLKAFQHHRVQVADQGTEAVLQALAVVVQVLGR